MVKVLVVDDSALMRRAIGNMLTGEGGFEVVTARNGQHALEVIADEQPDVVTLDVNMPVMDGLTCLSAIMSTAPRPVVMVSSLTEKGALTTLEALELGAVDYVSKAPGSGKGPASPGIELELAEKVANIRQNRLQASQRESPRALLKTPLFGKAGTPGASGTPERGSGLPSEERPGLARLVVIGASTGGPSALVEVFSQVRSCTSTAIVVAQHMPERFTRTFAERLNRLSVLRVSEAREFEPLHPGRAVLCPGGKCLEIVGFGHGFAASVVDPAPSDRFIPSADRLFKSAAEVARDKVIGVVLTGMGDDGARGVVSIKARGGYVLAESAETAVIYGMPGAAVRTGDVDRTLPLGALAAHLAELIV